MNLLPILREFTVQDKLRPGTLSTLWSVWENLVKWLCANSCRAQHVKDIDIYVGFICNTRAALRLDWGSGLQVRRPRPIFQMSSLGYVR